jgi:hypothetical protein
MMSDCCVHCNGVEERLVALHIHEDVTFLVRRHFGDTLRARAVIRTCHVRFAAKSLNGLHDALIIRCDYNAIGPLCQFGPLVDVLDHRFSRKRH